MHRQFFKKQIILLTLQIEKADSILLNQVGVYFQDLHNNQDISEAMKKENNPVYDRNTLEFVTVALEYCTFVESANRSELLDFVDKATKILPLLYLKASLLPAIEPDELFEPEMSVTEEMYESVRSSIAALL